MTVQAPEQTIAGYRCWVVQRRWWGLRLRLRASGSETIWPQADHEAKCLERKHPAPQRDCRCGIHACDSLATAERYLSSHHRWRWLTGERVVLGAVQLWGGPKRPVVVGELRGRPGLQIRAAFARIVALAEGPDASRLGAQLGVPVIPRVGLEPYAREMGGVQLRPPVPRPSRLAMAIGRLRRIRLPKLPERPAAMPRESTAGRPAAGWATQLSQWSTGRRPRTAAVGSAAAVVAVEVLVVWLLIQVLLLRVLLPLVSAVGRTERWILIRSWRHGLGVGLLAWWLGLGGQATLLLALLARGVR